MCNDWSKKITSNIAFLRAIALIVFLSLNVSHAETTKNNDNLLIADTTENSLSADDDLLSGDDDLLSDEDDLLGDDDLSGDDDTSL